MTNVKFYGFFFVLVFASSAYSQSASDGLNCYDSIEAPNLVLPFPRNTLAERANKGDSQAQFEVGEYFSSIDKQEYESALVWYNQSAGQGNISAMLKLANLYSKFGVFQYVDEIESNIPKGFSCFQLAADSGSGEGALYAGMLILELGDMLGKSTQDAMKYIQFAKRNGYREESTPYFLKADQLLNEEAKDYRREYYLSEEGVQLRSVYGIDVDGCPVESDGWTSRVNALYEFHLSTGFYSNANQVNGVCQICLGSVRKRLIQERRYDEQERLKRIGVDVCVSELNARTGIQN